MNQIEKEAMGEDLDNLNKTKRKSTRKNQEEVIIEEDEDEFGEMTITKSKGKSKDQIFSFIDYSEFC